MRERTPVQAIALLVGIVFLVVGILGFIPGVTTHYGDLSFIGHDSHAKLLGLFQISWVHNFVHLAFGVGILMSRTPEGARTYLIGGGIAYLLVWVLGIISVLDWLPINTADNWLHLGLSTGMIALGFVTGRAIGRDRSTAPAV